MDAKRVELVPLTRQGAPTPQATKDEVFRLWLELGRSWVKVAERTGIAVRTLHDWAETGKWEQRRLESAASLMPGLFVETVFSLRLAAHNAGVRLQQIAFDALNGIQPNEKEVKSLLGIVDRGGHSPVGSRPTPNAEFRSQSNEAVRELTDDDLSKRETDLGAGRQG